MILILLALLSLASPALAQELSTDPQQIKNTLQNIGCQAQIDASAQTIANLQKQVNDLQKQLKEAKSKKEKK